MNNILRGIAGVLCHMDDVRVFDKVLWGIKWHMKVRTMWPQFYDMTWATLAQVKLKRPSTFNW